MPPDGDERNRVGDVYRRYAASATRQSAWSADNPGNIAIRTELVEVVSGLCAADLVGARAILDIGCGSGWWLEQLQGDDRVTARLCGLELLPERAAAARARLPAADVKMGDARELPYESGSFDVVTVFTTLSSLATTADAELALAEALRVLRNPGGVLLIWEPRIVNPFNRHTILIGHRLIDRALAGTRVQRRTTTVLPALARRLGRRTERLYPLLLRIGPLQTHRLVCARVATRPS